jgi:hypothetical protein
MTDFESLGKLLIELEHREVIGKNFYKPLSKDGKFLLTLFCSKGMRKKMFSSRQVKLMVDYGWYVNVVPIPMEDFS